MKRFIYILAFIFIGTNSFSQDYNTGIGLRFGLSNGITVKHFLGSKTALEGIISSRWKGVKLTVLYEFDFETSVDRLHFFAGFGGHIGSWYEKHVPWSNGKSDNYRHNVLGVDGIVGLEYNFDEIPINLSIDWKPAINLWGYNGWWGDEGALSIRYIF